MDHKESFYAKSYANLHCLFQQMLSMLPGFEINSTDPPDSMANLQTT